MREDTQQGNPRCSYCQKGITGNAAWFEFTERGEPMRMCTRCFTDEGITLRKEEAGSVRLLWPQPDPEAVRMLQRADPTYRPPKPPRIVREFIEAAKRSAAP